MEKMKRVNQLQIGFFAERQYPLLRLIKCIPRDLEFGERTFKENCLLNGAGQWSSRKMVCISMMHREKIMRGGEQRFSRPV
jgi:hypothetical protein